MIGRTVVEPLGNLYKSWSGEYTFQVKTVSIDRKESNLGPILKIEVLAPILGTGGLEMPNFLTITSLFTY